MDMLSGRPPYRWFLLGMRGIFSLPALILLSAFVGFTGFAVSSGIPATETVFMVGIVWALPAKVLLIGSIMGGASLPAAFLAVTLSSIRMAPMVAALIPEIRGKNTPQWLLLLLSHFVAVTAWVYTVQQIPRIPREGRLPFFAGLGLTLVGANMLLVAVCYHLVSQLPAMVGGALFFLTPVYFLTSLWASARERVVHIAMVTGLLLAPLFHMLNPQFDLLYTGIAGGALSFAADRFLRGRKRSR